MLKKKKNKKTIALYIIPFSLILMLICLISTKIKLKASELSGSANNGYDTAQTETIFCAGTCKYKYEADKAEDVSGTEFKITLAGGVSVSVDVNGGSDSCYYGYQCQPENSQTIDGFPSPIYEKDGTVYTNEGYQQSVDAYLNDAKNGVIVDGKFNPNNAVGQAIIDALIKQTKGTESACTDAATCSDYMSQVMIGDLKEGQALEDYMDVEYIPYVMAHSDQGNTKLNYKNAGSVPGMNGVLNATVKSTKAGTSTNYTGHQKGDEGIGTYDAKTHINTVPTDFNPTVPEFDINTPDFKTFEPRERDIITDTLPTGTTDTLECGKNYEATTYSWGEPVDSCGLSRPVVKTVTTITAPSAPSTATAGQSVSWGGITSTQTVTTTNSLSTSQELLSTWGKTSDDIYNIKGQMEVYKQNMDAAKETYDAITAAKATCATNKATCEASIPAYESWKGNCGTKMNEKTGKEEAIECTKDNSELRSKAQAACNDANTQCLKNAEEAMSESKALDLYNEHKAIYDEYVSANSEQLANLEAEFERLGGCVQEVLQKVVSTDAQTITTSDNVATVSASTLNVGGESQASGSAVAVNKGSSGTASTTVNDNSIALTSGNFYVPGGISDGSSATVSEVVTLPNGESFTVACPLNISNPRTGGGGGGPMCTTSGCTPDWNPDPMKTNNELNLVYRTISLTNPFPNVSGTGMRKRGITWVYDTVVDNIITNNRGVNTYEIYNLTPMYTIVLTPSSISNIRKYNKTHAYNDYTLRCTKGLYCKSTFLREKIADLVDYSQSCGLDSDWYACDKSTSVTDYREKLLMFLK